MGTLVAMHYPTDLALGLADHTYVKCANNGKAWGCWGGNTGGTELKRGNGSTLRADAIAGHDEKAGIRCYLINGVCHQCANRILLPANITVDGARGYRISEARFGVYGRPKGRGLFRHCVAPFNQHPAVTGELPECVSGGAGPHAGGPDAPPYPGGGSPDSPHDPYLEQVRRLYDGRSATHELAASLDGADLVEFMLAQFDLRMEFSGVSLGDVRGRLRDIRAEVEQRQIRLEEDPKLPASQLPEESDRLTLEFQNQLAAALDAARYFALFQLTPDELVRLAEPQITRNLFGPR